MKVYITGKFTDKASKQRIHALSAAVREAGMDDMCFLRDVEHYKHTFASAKEKWAAVYDELAACDMLLVDLADNPHGRRAVECGMALALKKPIILAIPKKSAPKKLFTDLASTVIKYDSYKDITQPLKAYDKQRNFNLTDQVLLFTILLFVGGVGAWILAQIFIPLGLVWPVVYWWLVRRFIPGIRAFDRIAIYLPLAALWIGGIVLLNPILSYLAWGWAIGYWFVVLIILQKLKFSL